MRIQAIYKKIPISIAAPVLIVHTKILVLDPQCLRLLETLPYKLALDPDYSMY